MPIRAFRYRRVSGESQRDNSSLATQLDRMNAHCLLHGYPTPDEDLFTEVQTGVESWRERAELQRMLALIERLSKDPSLELVCVVDHPDRFARGLDLILLVELLTYYHCCVEFVQKQLEDTDEGKLILHLESYSSKKEWLRIKKRTEDGRIDRVIKQHKLPGSGNPLYGYKYDDPSPKQKNRYLYNEDVFYTDATGTKWSERKVVEFVFAQAKSGVPIRRIATMLNELGVPTRGRRGNTFWRHSFIGQMLANPAYAGRLYSYQRTYIRRGSKYTHKPKPLEDQFLMPEGTCPPIIDEETFQLVQAQLAHNQRMASRNNKHPELALCRVGIARCGVCGGSMVYRSSNGAHGHYCCSKGLHHYGCSPMNTISTKIADEAVWKRVCEVIRSPTLRQEAIEKLRTPDPTFKEGIPLERRKQQAQEEIAHWIEMSATATSQKGKNLIKAHLAEAEVHLAELEQEEAILKGIKTNWQEAEQEIRRFEYWCISQQDSLDTADYAHKRTCVEYLGVQVKIFRYGSPKRITIELAPPNILQALAGKQKNASLRSDSREYKV